jgi:hypothetical protein
MKAAMLRSPVLLLGIALCAACQSPVRPAAPPPSLPSPPSILSFLGDYTVTIEVAEVLAMSCPTFGSSAADMQSRRRLLLQELHG